MNQFKLYFPKKSCELKIEKNQYYSIKQSELKFFQNPAWFDKKISN